MSLRPLRAGAPAERAGRRVAGLSGLPVQFALVALAALAYFGVRGITQSSYEAAEANARDLVALQDVFGVSVEGSIQGAVLGHDWLVTLANWIYIYGHWPLIVATMVILYLRVPAQFRTLRNAMFASGAIGLVIFALYPVAPPRLIELDLVDTVTERSTSYRALQPPSLTNPYAALPSLHVGWNLLVGIVLWRATTNLAVRAFALAMPLLMAFAVVATANHYVIDVAAGALVALAGLVIVRRLQEDRPDEIAVRAPR